MFKITLTTLFYLNNSHILKYLSFNIIHLEIANTNPSPLNINSICKIIANYQYYSLVQVFLFINKLFSLSITY